MSKFHVNGDVSPEFESVRLLFSSQMSAMAEQGAQLCVYHRGLKVIDLWGGVTESQNFSADALVNIFSSGKSFEAIAIASLVDKGLLDYRDPISKYWPEFAAYQKGSMEIADLMRHEAGMATFDQTMRVGDLFTASIKENAVGRVVEAQKPTLGPDGKAERRYHAITRGWIANEIFRRIDPAARTIGEYLSEDLCQPLQADIVVGVKDDRWQHVAPVFPLGFGYQLMQSLLPRSLGRRIEHNFLHVFDLFLRILPDFFKSKGFGAPVPIEGMKNLEIFNQREFARGETPSANTHASARGLAKVAAMMAAGGKFDGHEYLSQSAWSAMHADPLPADMGGILRTRFTQGGIDQYLPTPIGSRFDKALNNGREGFYGWMGLGGSIFQWHPEYDIGFGFVPTALHSLDLLNERGKNFQAEVLRCVEKIERQS